MAEDWIRAGRCRRVVIVAADDVTSETLLPWVGSGFLASGAAATDEVVEEAALPFDRRRHGMILGMGAAGIVVESAAAARERGVTPICEVLGAVTANSAFHGSRLDVEHIGGVMESVVRQAEARGVTRDEIAPETVFVSHETYTPARGGSAAAEIHALRRVFGEQADQIVIANTKGITGHPMGVGIEDVVAIKALETGLVPAVPNFREIDPELGALNLSKGGLYPVRYALRLAAGFGSQISMTAAALDAGRRRPAPHAPRSSATTTGSPTRRSGRRGCAASADQAEPQLEVVKRHLRVVDTGPAANGALTPVPVAAPRHRPGPRRRAATPAPAPARRPVAPVAGPPQPAGARAGQPAPPRRADARRSRPRSWRSSPRRPATRPTCSTPSSTSKPTSASTPSSRPRCSPPSASATAIARDDTLKLRDYPTLRHVVGFVEDRTAPAAGTAPRRRAPRRRRRARARRPDAGAAAADDARRSRPRSWRSSPSRPATRPTCSTPSSTSRPTSASTPSSRPRCSPPSASATRSPATTPSSSATTPPCATSSASSKTAPHRARPRPRARGAAARAAAGAAAPAAVAAPAPARRGRADDGGDHGRDPGDRRRADRLPGRHARPRARPRGRPRHRHRQAGRDVRRHPRALRDRPRRHPQAARLPDPAPRRRLRRRPHRAPADPAPRPAPAPTAARAGRRRRRARRSPRRRRPRAAPTTEEITAAILEIVAAQTGYPADMLDPELDLEADLGIDTVKQAEMFAAIRERYGDRPRRHPQAARLPHPAPRRRLRRRPHRTRTAPAAAGRRPAAPASPGPSPSRRRRRAAAPTTEEITAAILEIVAAQTGYPADMLDPELDLEADLGIDTVKQAEMFAAIRERYAIARDDTLKLRDYPTLRHVVGFVEDRTAPAPRPPRPRRAPARRRGAPRRSPASPARSRAACRCRCCGRRSRVRADTGVDPRRGRRVMRRCPTRAASATALAERLRERGVEVLSLDPALASDAVEARLAEWSRPARSGRLLAARARRRGPARRRWTPGLAAEALRRPRQAASRVTMRELTERPSSFAARASAAATATTPPARRPRWAAPSPASPRRCARERPDALVKAVDFASGAQDGRRPPTS